MEEKGGWGTRKHCAAPGIPAITTAAIIAARGGLNYLGGEDKEARKKGGGRRGSMHINRSPGSAVRSGCKRCTAAR